MSTHGNSQRRISRILGAALLTGGVTAGALMLATQIRAQTPPPAAAPPPPAATAPAPPQAASMPPPAGFVPMTDIPFFADWASSPHADKKAEPFIHWNKEGVIPTECAQCHSTPGFRDYVGADGSTPFKVDHPAAIGTVITCVACHNDKTVRLSKVIFPSGIAVERLGAEARCMTCHQGRESTKSVNMAIAGIPDDQISPKLDFVNVHYAAAGATLYGGQVQVGYEYTGKTYAGRYAHKEPYVTCTNCHNPHTLAVKVDDCAACHKEVTGKASLHTIRTSKVDRDGNGNIKEGVAQEIEHLRGKLFSAIQAYAKTVSSKPIIYDPHAYPYFFNDKNDNSQTDKGEAIFPNRYKSWTPRLMKAAYNYQFVTKDPGAYAHNGPYTIELLQDSLNDLSGKVEVDLGKAVRP